METIALLATLLATSAALQLPLLPFPVADALLPGETKALHLYEARFLQLLTDAKDKHHERLGQMLITPQGNVAAYAPLCVLDETRVRDVGVWARLKCVGRVRLIDVAQTDFQYALATVESVADSMIAEPSGETPLPAEAGADVEVERQVRKLYGSCTELEAKLAAAGGDVAAALATGDAGSRDDEVEFGHETRTAEFLPFTETLEDSLERASDLLLSRGLDTSPHISLCDAVGGLWDVHDEETAARQLLSFVAATNLSPQQRTQAIGLRSTVERLSLCASALRTRQQRLAAQIALRNAMGGGGSDDASIGESS